MQLIRSLIINVYCAVIGCSFSHVLLLLVKVSLIMFLHYGLYVDVPLPLSQLVSLSIQVEREGEARQHTALP